MPRYSDGNATRMAWTQLDHIEDLDESFDDFAAHKAYFEQYSPADLFRKGIDQRLLALQYDGSMEDTDEKVRFLHAQFAKNQVEEVSEQTLRNWPGQTKTERLLPLTLRSGTRTISSGCALRWK